MMIRQLFHVKYVKKSTFLKWTYGLFGHNNRVATFSIFYLTELGIIMSIMPKLTKRTIHYGRIDGQTLIIEEHLKKPALVSKYECSRIM